MKKKHKWEVDDCTADASAVHVYCIIDNECDLVENALLEERLNLFEYLTPIEIEGLKKRMEEYCSHPNAVSAKNEVVEDGYYCPDCNAIFSDLRSYEQDSRGNKE